MVLAATNKQSGNRVEVSIRGISEIEVFEYLEQERVLHAANPGGFWAEFTEPSFEFRYRVEKSFQHPAHWDDAQYTVEGWFSTSMSREEVSGLMDKREISSLDSRITWDSDPVSNLDGLEYIDWSFVLVEED